MSYLLWLDEESFLNHLPERIRPEVGFFKSNGIVAAYKGIRKNFTLIVLRHHDNSLYAGISKRNPLDSTNGDTGLTIACVRALREFTMDGDPGYGRQQLTLRRKKAQKPIERRIYRLSQAISRIKQRLQTS
jgi:hypothetical protein